MEPEGKTDSKDRGKGTSKKGSKSVDKTEEEPSCSYSDIKNTRSSTSSNNMKEDIDILKSQIMSLTPMIKEISDAYKSQGEQKKSQRSFIESTDDEPMFSEEEEGEIHDNLEQFMKLSGISEDQGPKLNDTLSKGLEEMLSKGIKTEIKEELIKKYKTPENCKRLEIVQCNQEVYKKSSKNTRIIESKLQDIQQCLNKGICAMAIAFNESLKALSTKQEVSDEKFKEMNSINTDAITLFSQATHMMDIFRKMNFRKEFKREYSSLCKEVEIRENLFGKDLAEKVKSISETNKLTNLMSGSRKRKHGFLDRNQQRQPNYQNRQSYSRQNYQRREKTNFKQWAYKKGEQKKNPQKAKKKE